MTRLILALLLGTTTTVQAQQLSLKTAIETASRSSFPNRLAGAHAREQAAGALQPLHGILPTVRVEAGAVRTTDPIGAFGTTLRQRRISAADFDPGRLNYPAPVSNYMASLVAEQPIFNADAHLGRMAARHAASAAESDLTWTVTGSHVDVIKAYYGAVLAREKATTLEAALKAARAHVEQAGKLLSAGLVTRSDVLLASVKAGEIESALIRAQGEAGIARSRLALVMGEPGDTAAQLPAFLPDYSLVRALLQAAPSHTATRADVQSADQLLAATSANVQRARSLYLPRVNAFARYDWNSPSDPFGGDKNWSIGVLASWTPFAGASEWADRRAAQARNAAATAGREMAHAQATLELESAQSDVRVASAGLDLARVALDQAIEAHRIVARKYDGGLGTVTELLDAAAMETQARLGFAAARFEGIVAQAALFRAAGGDVREIADIIDNQRQEARK